MQTDIYYPPQLPNPLREGHALEPTSPFARTQLASGRSRQRLEFSNVPITGTWDFLYTAGQAALFESWFANTIGDGTEWFNIQRRTPLGMRMLVCRFASMYRGPVLAGVNMFRYSCPLEIYQRDLLPPEWLIVPEFVARMDVFDIAMNKEWPKHVSQ